MENLHLIQVHQLLLHDSHGDFYPRYDVDESTSCFVVNKDPIMTVYQLRPSSGYVVVPLVELGDSSLPDTAMAMVEAILMERDEPVQETASIQDAIVAGASHLDNLDLKLSSILVQEGTEVPVEFVKEMKLQVAFHKDVEPGLVICFPSVEFFGYLLTNSNKFGMLVHNPNAAIPIQVRSS